MSPTRVRAHLGHLFLALITSTASAQVSPVSFDPDSALAAALRELSGEPLRLDRALEIALDGATEIRAARAERQAADGARLAEAGTFDPELFGEFSRGRVETPSSSPFARPDVIDNETSTARAGARLTLPFGTEIEASIDATKLETNSLFASINPEYRATGLLELRQPLLKGFGPGTSGSAGAAARESEAADARYRDAVFSLRARVESTYWELYAAERDVAVQELIVDRAEALLEQARLRARAGLVGPNEVASARAFLAEQRIAALDRGEDLVLISDRLATLLGSRPAGDRFRTRDEPPARFPADDVDSLLSRAFRNNSQLRSAERTLAGAKARAASARWNALPELDLVGSIGGAGLAGRAQEVIFGGDTLRVDTSGGYSDAIGEAVGRDFPSWSVGVEITLPLPFRSERGERRRFNAEVDRQRAVLEATRRSLEERVRAAHRELVNSRERLEVAEEGVDAAFEQVRIGLIEYDNGRTTAFELVRLGADLASAQQRRSDALVRAATAAADLRYLTAERE